VSAFVRGRLTLTGFGDLDRLAVGVSRVMASACIFRLHFLAGGASARWWLFVSTFDRQRASITTPRITCRAALILPA